VDICHLYTTVHFYTTIYLTTNYLSSVFFFFINDTATPKIYTLSLHDALPIYSQASVIRARTKESKIPPPTIRPPRSALDLNRKRSEEHTSELQSRENLVCRLLLEKKKNRQATDYSCLSPGCYLHRTSATSSDN